MEKTMSTPFRFIAMLAAAGLLSACSESASGVLAPSQSSSSLVSTNSFLAWSSIAAPSSSHGASSSQPQSWSSALYSIPLQSSSAYSSAAYSSVAYSSLAFSSSMASSSSANQVSSSSALSSAGSSSSAAITLGEVIDSRDGRKYQTVLIGTQTWMAQSLNYNPGSGNSWCYGGDTTLCAQYGRLYDWATAQTACPITWHLATDADWDALGTYAGGASNAGTVLKAKSGWDSSGNGTDALGFSALAAGGNYTGAFSNIGQYGVWWTSTNSGTPGTQHSRSMIYNSTSLHSNLSTATLGFSARCVAD